MANDRGEMNNGKKPKAKANGTVNGRAESMSKADQEAQAPKPAGSYPQTQTEDPVQAEMLRSREDARSIAPDDIDDGVNSAVDDDAPGDY